MFFSSFDSVGLLTEDNLQMGGQVQATKAQVFQSRQIRI